VTAALFLESKRLLRGRFRSETVENLQRPRATAIHSPTDKSVCSDVTAAQRLWLLAKANGFVLWCGDP
jgi:hypothetical protein